MRVTKKIQEYYQNIENRYINTEYSVILDITVFFVVIYLSSVSLRIAGKCAPQ